MQQSRSGPRALDRPVGRSSPSWRPRAAAPPHRPPRAPQPPPPASAAAAATPTPPPAVTPPPLAAGCARTQRRRRHQLVRRPRRRRSAAAAPGRGAVRQRLQRVAEGRLHRAGDPEQQRRRAEAQDPIAAGDAPDIIGPVGVEGLNLFRDNLLDLAPLIAKTNYSVPGVDPKLVDFFKLGANGATIGVPYAVYPSYLYFNKDLFDEARTALPADQGRRALPGQAVGHGRGPHPRHEADRRLGGQRRHQREVRPDEGRPVGLRHAVLPTTARWPRSSLFGPGSFVAADGKTAQIPRPRHDRARSGTTTASGRTTSSPAQPRSAATCSTRATSSSRATWR